MRNEREKIGLPNDNTATIGTRNLMSKKPRNEPNMTDCNGTTTLPKIKKSNGAHLNGACGAPRTRYSTANITTRDKNHINHESLTTPVTEWVCKNFNYN